MKRSIFNNEDSMTLFLKFTAIGLLFFYILNTRKLNAAAPWEYTSGAEFSKCHRHSRNRIKEPTADEVLKEFCREFPCAGLRRDWTFVTDNVNQCLGK